MSRELHPCSSATSIATRQRLLNAASLVFSEAGFHHATVREICRQAEVNIAAINYHFGDKEQLYRAVLREGSHQANEKYPLNRQSLTPDIPAPERLRLYICTLLKRIFDPDRAVTHGRIMVREIIEPTAALDMLIQEFIKPASDLLHEIVGELLGPDASKRRVLMASNSIIGQCVYYAHCRVVIDRIYEEKGLTPGSLEQLSEHITNFSLGALRELAKGNESRAS